MKLLVDACVWGGAVVHLRDLGHDAIWAGDWGSDPGDLEILRLADAQGRVLVTLDKDFGELAIKEGATHCGIVRLARIRAKSQGPACADVLKPYGSRLLDGTVTMVVVEPGRVRIRERQAGVA